MTNLCEHLSPYLEELVGHGAEIVSREESWTNCILNLVLSKGPAIADMRQKWEFPGGIESWFSTDSHYAIKNGNVCKKCKMSLSWPRLET